MTDKLKLISTLGLIIILAAIPRFLLLNTIPAGVNYDELDYLLNAKAIYQTGTDLTNTWNPLSLTTLPTESPKGELVSLILAPFIGPLPFSPFNLRYPFALFGILSVVLVYLITRKLWSEKPALIASLVWAINPLAIFNSRVGFDAPIAATLYLLFFTILLYASNWSLLFALIPLFLAFYTYIGTKLIFLPFAFITILYTWKKSHRQKYAKQHRIILLVTALIFIHFIVKLPSLPASNRSASLLQPNSQIITEEVNRLRLLSLQSPASKLPQLIVNKYTIYLSEILNRFLGAFSTQLLFTSGDTYHAFFIWNHGLFYYTDSVFLLIGAYVLYRKHRQSFWLYLGLIPILLLPTLVSSTDLSYIYRSYLFFVFVATVIGLGIWTTISRWQHHQKIIVVSFIVIYSLQIANFLNNYFFRNPVYHESQFQLTHRVLTRFLLHQAQTKNSITVIGTSPKQLYQQFILYSPLYDQLGNHQLRSDIANQLLHPLNSHNNEEYTFQNITFTSDCQKIIQDEPQILVLHDDLQCPENQSLNSDFISIARISDSSQEFKIYNSTSCNPNTLSPYIRSTKLANLNIEALPLDQFCSQFFTHTPVSTE